MNNLKDHLINLIRHQGPIPLSTYMAEALSNPVHGYYMKQDPFGVKGDFTTAPEVSQMFGELIGLWLAQNWIQAGSPGKIHLVELGPGRGTLMQDALRAMKIVPGLIEAITLHLVEMSPVLRQKQQESLSTFITPDWTPHWHNRLNDVLLHAQDGPLFLVANEFFDALPIRQYQKTETGWHERLVAVAQQKAELIPVLSPHPVQYKGLIPEALDRAEIGAVAELCPAGESIIRDIAEHVRTYGGVALIIDYGHIHHGIGDTLQAVAHHEYTDIFADPGNADLTAHVDFETLQERARESGAATYGPVPQGQFLTTLGIEERAQALLSKATEKQRIDIMMAVERLVATEEMGHLFKVLAVADPGLPVPPGFEGG
ncbi:class I SAM-dependent methyltransferase [Luteithermobacter gelatinilyticus]|uniref:class I SAM-dependent methyltransferase n=1 Tax=Luteithermobacter gelatinilyticus TaxID=2582913 RepID=UPI0011063A5F|nr:SAM-dependent methyltransferase [Luteithermobacter gelatinilyticus]